MIFDEDVNVRESRATECAFEPGVAGSRDPDGALAPHLQAVLDNLPAMVGYWDTTLHNTLANQAYLDWFGLTPAQMNGMHIRDVIGEKLFTVNEPYMRLALQGEPQTFLREITDAHGQVRHTKASYLPDLLDGVVRGFVALVVDVTDLHEARQQAESASAFFEAVVIASPDFTFVVNLVSGEVVYGSRDRDVLGLTVSDLAKLGADAIALLVHPEDQPQLRAMNTAAATLAQAEVLQLRYRGRHADGNWRWLNRRITPFRRNASGEVVEVLGVVRDVTELVEAEARLAHAALHDRLTGLPNRALLLDRLEAALARSAREEDDGVVSLLFCDLDGFKRVNDLAGHAVGDAVLVEAAHRLQSVVREGETVARLGGDEFVIIVEPWHRHLVTHQAGEERDAAVDVARRISEVLRPPVLVSGREYVLGASIGIAHSAAAGARLTLSASELLQRADAAMYEAKARGRDRYEVFEQGMRTTLLERGHIEQVLREALRPGASGAERLCAHYQPIFCSRTGHLSGFEALARLTDANGLAIAPDAFIAVAEDSGLIQSLGTRMLDLACSQLTAWRDGFAALAAVTMAVNISPLQARHSPLSDDISSALSRHGLAYPDLVLELTETALLEAAGSTMKSLHRMRARGIGIAVDDFGTGYASLTYLATLPVTDIKVDRSFTAGLPGDPTSAKIVRAVARLAEDLELRCIVEGLETEAQRHALPPNVYLQGFLTGRPQSPESLTGHMTHLMDLPAGARQLPWASAKNC
jgi:diguanylate cyclase (GGDEF)-like protein/PAS domain S-box-containing protein